MASTKLMTTVDGRRFYKISVSRGYGKSPYSMRWYWPLKEDGDPVTKSTAERELKKAVAEFERACAAGEVLTRAEQKKKAAQEAAEAAKLKTVRQYADSVFMPSKEATISENTRASYRTNLDRHILPVLGDVVLREVTPAMITALLVDFQKSGHSHASTVKLYNVLNGLFDMAFLDDSIPISPMLKVKRPAPRKDEKIQDEATLALTAEDLNRVLECVESEPLKWKAYIYLLADTGLRRGEACGLRWSDINFKEAELTVRHNLQYTAQKGIYDTGPKNGRVRVVDIGPEVVEILHRLRVEQATTGLSQYVFSQDGSPLPMNPQTPTRYFKKFGERHGIKNFHPHLLRHTVASLSVTSGADLKSTADRLGHSEAVMLRKYLHSNKGSVKASGQAARDARKRAQNE